QTETYSDELGRLLWEWMGAGNQTLNIEHRTSNIEHRTSNIEHRTSNIERATSNAALTPARSPSDGERENRRPSPGEFTRVEVINAGVNAWSFQQMLVFYRDFAAAWKPDAVVLADANLWTQFSE